MASTDAVTGQAITWDGTYFIFDPQKPALTAGTTVRTGDATATAQFDSTQAGTYFYQLDGAAPTANGLIASALNPTPLVSGANAVSLSGLTAGTHTLYIAAVSEAGVMSVLLTVEIPAYDSGDGTTPPGTTTPDELPPTGDAGGLGGLAIALIAALLGAAALTARRRHPQA
jgi:hypothetical protein